VLSVVALFILYWLLNALVFSTVDVAFFTHENLATLAICRFSKQGTSFQGSTAMVFNETTIYAFSLPSKHCQRHLET